MRSDSVGERGVDSNQKNSESFATFQSEIMAFVMNVPAGEKPKRGDLMRTNVGNKRERTWMILRVHRINPIVTNIDVFREWAEKPRYAVWRARWWELEPEMRMRLYRSAERAGGQVIWSPDPGTFEDLRKKK